MSARASFAADKFDMSLAVSDAGQSVSTSQPSTQPSPPSTGKASTRSQPTLECAADAPLMARWKVTYTGTEPLADVVVHFYVVRVERFGDAPPALEPAKVVVESAVLMDFEARTNGSAEIPFRVQSAGKYLVWIETTIKAGKDTEEQHAAVDLAVK